MLIVLGFYRRRTDLTVAQYRAHWRDVHGPLIRRIADEHGLLLRYLQHHLTPDAGYPDQAGVHADVTGGFDGFSEGWFADEAARDAFFALPVMQTEVLEDERKFIDVSATRWVVTDSQHTIIEGPPTLVDGYMLGQKALTL
ncbi:MAG: EthD domain-containing protein [Novosphingobium sp.]|nr:EthD domain-containing protein [Novosphingobium sp.]